MITALVIGGVVAAIVAAVKRPTISPAAVAAGVLAHKRSGSYPSTCSWCKNTALASRLFVFRRDAGNWRAFDLAAAMMTCDDSEVRGLADVYAHSLRDWRRFCTEKCAREYLASEHHLMTEAFEPCSYCSTRFPMKIGRCPTCGASRT